MVVRKLPRSPVVIGEVFRRLTAIERLDVLHSNRRFRCQCLCGNQVVVNSGNLTSGRTLSCGCLQRQRRIESHTTHGACKVPGYTPEYRIWCHIIDRCTNPRAPRFLDYGGRGIKMCDRWRNSFPQFLSDIGPRPSPKHSLDRYPDNDGNYEPGNCRWATCQQQNRNQRSTVFLTLNGETECVAEWASRIGMKPTTLRARLRAGWSIERALTFPHRYRTTCA